MTKRKKSWLTVAASVAGAVALLVLIALLTVQSQWFGNYVKNKVIATMEESTGGRVDISSFHLDPWHLSVRIRNFVLHGTEPAGAAPLARADLLVLQLKLFAGLKKAVDLAYLGLVSPKVNLIVNADGTTNVPAPKIKKETSQTSGLETVVDLAIGEFRIENGLLLYAQRSSNFSAQGKNLQVLLSFNSFNSSYTGNVKIDPLQIAAGTGTPLAVQVNLPVLLEKDAVSVSGGRLSTGLSQVLVNAGLRDLNAPHITGRVNANISLAEMQQSFDLPLDAAARNVPQFLTAELGANYDQKTNALQVQAAHLALGQTNFEASGTLRPAGTEVIQFNGNLALAELSRLLKLGSTQLSGALQLNGKAALDANGHYAVDGKLMSKGLGIRSGTTNLSDVSLSSPFHADPYLASLDGLKMSALGGNLAAKVFVEKMERLSVEGHLRNFALPVLAKAFTGDTLGYSGSIGGSIAAKSDLKAKGMRGLTARTQLVITPGAGGVPISGRIAGRFNGASGIVDLEDSFVALPHSRIDLAGALNKQLNVLLVSQNLNDFLPAVNFGSAHPAAALPLTLQGGEARVDARIKGDLSAPKLEAHASIDRFAVQGSPIQHVALDLGASPDGADVRNGVLTSEGLRSSFDASLGLRKWQPISSSPLSANLSVPNGDLAGILNMAGQKVLPASGKINAELHVRGTYGDPLGNASLQLVNGIAYAQPFDKVQANIDLAHELITLSTLEIDAAGGRLLANGTFRHPRDSLQVGHVQFHVGTNDVQLANIRPLQQRSPGVGGILKLVADGAGDLRKIPGGTDFAISNVSTDLSASGLKLNNQAAGNLSAQARTVNGNVQYKVNSDFAGSAIRVDGQTSLATGFVTKAVASIENLSVEKALAIAGQGGIPAKGILSANANVSGPLAQPDALVDLKLAKAVIYAEPLNEFNTRLHYTGTQVDIPSLNLDAPAGTLSASGNYAHKLGDFNNGRLRLHIGSSDIDLSKIKHLVQAEPGVAGGLKLVADLAGDVRAIGGKPALLLSDANADLRAHSLQANNKDLGDLHFSAKTQKRVVTFDLASNLAQSKLSASGQTQLSSQYPTHAKLAFENVRYANIAPFIPADNPAKPAFDALVEGVASVDGALMNFDALTAKLQLNQLQVKTTPPAVGTGAPVRKVQLQNQGPVIVSLDHSVVKVEQLKIEGPKTLLEAGGSVSLKDNRNAYALTLKGNADLGILQDADRDFYSSGSVLMDATVHGSLAKPLVNGRVELQNANVNYADAPNGLSNGNGVILLNGTNATIENLTGESGGGKISITGFAGYSPTAVIFNLRATANKVRTRYADASITSSANIYLAGNTARSTLNGQITVQRIAYTSSSDAGSILSNASVPPSTPEAPSPFLSGMHLDIRIVTSPDLRVVTTYAQKMSVTSNLNIRGTAQDPGIVGRLNITNGELVFFGNTYTVNTGSVNFYNPNAIQPILDLSLETIAQGVNVTLGVTGPVNDLKLSYRSDPPLNFEQIVQLLATNTTPSDPTIAAHQPTPASQSVSQMGESAILGQAVANPLASRVQRVFGLSQFKIDPSFSGSNGQPSARVTLQQKIASNVTFTYITDVTQTNSAIVRVQIDLAPKVSAVALRDYNGNVSLQFFYKFQKR